MLAGRTPDPAPAQEHDHSLREQARAAFETGNMADAAQGFRDWLRANPGDDAARMLLGRALYGMDRHVQALVEFERAARRTDDGRAWLFVCLCRLRLGRCHKAVEAFESGHAAYAAILPGTDAGDLAQRVRAVADDPAASDGVVAALELALTGNGPDGSGAGA